MPWSGKSFKSRHAHGLSGKQAGQAARQANAMLRSGADEGVAIATAIKHAKARQEGGPVTGGPVTPAGLSYERRVPVGRNTEGFVRGSFDPESKERSVRVGITRRFAKGGLTGAGRYLTGEVGPELMVPSDGSPPSMVGSRGPEVIAPTKKGAIVPNHELKRLGKKYAAKRQAGGPVSPDTPQAGFKPSGKQVEGLMRRGIISAAKKEKRLGKYDPGAKQFGKNSDTTPIDAATR